MFKSSAPNPYDEIVVKATDENLTAENWEVIISLCDKVTDEGENGARNVIAAVVKRMAHRNPNVQLYALALSESLTKNCGIALHREVSSRSFTQALEKIITDRTTHDKVKRRALNLIATWAAEFENNPSLGIMEECYTSLKARGFKFDFTNEAPPVKVDDELRRKEEEELQRVLEMSMHDKGGREQWSNYLASSNGAGGSGSGSSSALHAAQPSQSSLDHKQKGRADQEPYQVQQTPSYSTYTAPATSGNSQPQPSRVTSPPALQEPAPISPSSAPVTRVRALHKFQATEAGELAFEKNDIIKVVDRIYKDWWRGQLRGRTGIFPVNYVEPLSEPTPAEIAKEGEQEAAIFAQAANIEKLLTMLRNLDPEKDNLADNEEIQELYRTSMSLRPKIVKLIDRYNQKKAELVTMNETFVKAKQIFDHMMEESLSRHTVDYSRPYQDYGPPRQQPVWNAAMYDQGPGYSQHRVSTYTPGPYQGGQFGFPPNVHQQPSQTPGPHIQPMIGPQPQVGSPKPVPVNHQQSLPALAVNQHGAQQPIPPVQQHQQPPFHAQEAINQQEAMPQPHPAEQQQESMDGEGGMASVNEGPPYDYDPNAEYPDPNATAWARYYAQGGSDLQGAVYFKSIPGIKEPEGSIAVNNENHSPTQAAANSQYPGPLAQTQMPSQYQSYQPQVIDNPQLTQVISSPEQSHHSPMNSGQQINPPQGSLTGSPTAIGAAQQSGYGYLNQPPGVIDELQHRFSAQNIHA